MKTERHSVVLASSLTSAVYVSRGHRSLGDGEKVTLAAGKGPGSLQDRTNLSSRGWNNSTRTTSPSGKRNVQDNKENAKLPVIKKFQHVQSKLSAPVFAQRRLKHPERGDRTGITEPGGPLQSSTNTLNANAPPLYPNNSSNRKEPNVLVTSVPFDHFVTIRYRGEQLVPECSATNSRQQDATPKASGMQIKSAEKGPDHQQIEPSTYLPPVTPVAQASPHPSVSALYQFAKDMCTPASAASKGSTSRNRDVECRDMFQRLEGPVPDDVEEASRDDLTDSFSTWLASMGMEAGALAPIALDKMHALWVKAKEALQLEALVEQLRDAELQLAEKDGRARDRCEGGPGATDEGLQGRQATLQQQLLDAQERLAQLSFPQTLAANNHTSIANEAPLLGQVCSMNPQTEVDSLEPSTSVSSSAVVPVAQAFSPVGSAASVALWVQAPGRGLVRSPESPNTAHSTGDSVTVAQADDSSTDCAADGSIEPPQGSQVGLCSSSKRVDYAATRTELESSYSASVVGAAVCEPIPSPGFSVTSLTPEAVPFTTLVAALDDATCPLDSPQVLLRPTDLFPSPACSPEGAMLSPGGIPSPQAAKSNVMMPQSHQQSADLSCISRPCQPVAFAMWFNRGKLDQTPGAASDCHGPSSACANSPQVSAGLSVISSTPQALAFDVWASIQRANMAQAEAGNLQKTPGVAYTSTSPLSSVGPETVSKPDPGGSWGNSAASTPLAVGGVSCMEGATAAPHVRCNPLFEIDSPASTMSALPERADALGGLAPTPTPTRKILAPSLASTPMSAFSQGLCSDLASPVGECSPGLFHVNGFVAGDVASPTAAVSSTGMTTAMDTASPVTMVLSKPVAERLLCGKISEAIEAREPKPTEEQSPVQTEASFREPMLNTVDGEEVCFPPSGEEVSPDAEIANIALAEADHAEHTSPKDILSPAADVVITTTSVASPAADPHVHKNACVETQPLLQAAVDSLVDPNKEANDPEQGASVVNCSSRSYPNTPLAASPAPTISTYATPLDAFPTPTSLASVYSALFLTAMRMRSGPSSPSGQGTLAGDGSPPEFTFRRSLVQLEGCGMNSPMLIMRPAVPTAANDASNSNAALPVGSGSPSNGATFGSPMPLIQLTPVQMRVLDQLAAHIVAALSPACKVEAPDGPDSSPSQAGQEQAATGSEVHSASAKAAAAAFNLDQLLAHLRSPLPVPVHQRNQSMRNLAHENTAIARTNGGAAPTSRDGEDTVSVSETLAPAMPPEPSALNDAAPAPCPSPMPNFARLMAFLNGSGRIATIPNGPGAQPAAAEIDVGDPPKASALGLNFGHVLAQLHSPEHDLNAVRPKNAAFGPGYTDSPITAHDGHDSPATSEAASFGFSTAAKQMASRITPSTTPGGHAISFMRWAHDAGPPSFRLDSDAPRGRANRTPTTPMSFSFGATQDLIPTNEYVTPVVEPHRAKTSSGAQGPSPKKLLHLHLSPVLADVEEAQPGSTAASPGDGGKALSVSFSVNALEASTVLPNVSAGASPAFSFGPQSGHMLDRSAVTMGTPASSKQHHLREAAESPLTLSYLSSGTPPSTPPTAELVSTGKAGSLLCHSKASPRLSAGSSRHFWAPSSSGPSAAAGERVMLEAPNRRICTNADLLLDFQGSPAHVVPTVPVASVTGALTPRMKGASPAAWEGAHAPLASVHNLLPAASGGGGSKTKLQPKEPQPMTSGLAFAAARSHVLQPGRGPPLQQLVASGIEYTLASAAAAVVQHSSAAPMGHLPLSHRLGLWPTAAWGIPCSLPADAAVGTSFSDGSIKAAEGQQEMPSQLKATTGRPVVTSRDVQTTPGLIKTHGDNDDKVSEIVVNGETVTDHPQPAKRIGIVPEGPVAGDVVRKPGFRSRIPLPGGMPLNVATDTNNTRPQVPSASAASSSDSEVSVGTAGMPQERVVRRRRLLSCAAAAGGPQRVLVKRSAQRTSTHDVANITMVLGEEEVRRRARVLGMRISPYLRNKQSKVRPPEVPKPKKG